MKKKYPKNYNEENYNKYDDDFLFEEDNKELDLEGIGSDILYAYFEARESDHYNNDDEDYSIYKF